MELEQNETFALTGPQLEVLGEAESRLPAPARRRPFANIVLGVAILVAVFGIGGARLKGAQQQVSAQYTAVDEYNHGILSDLSVQADAAASMIRIAGGVLGPDHPDVAAAQAALDGFDPLAQAPDAACAANRALYGAIHGLYNTARLAATGDAAERIEGLNATFVSAQATIDRAAAQYNQAARAYNEKAAGFPAGLVGALWGAGELPLFI